MTRVLMNMDLLAYQQGMKDALRQVVQYNFVDGVAQPERVDLEACLLLEEVLPPPEIELISLDAYDGQDPEKDFIAAQVYTDFGIASMHITIRDLQGNVIESGEMDLFPNSPQFWDYLPTVRVPLGTNVIVEVTAVDCMGGIGTRRLGKTIGEEW